MCLLFYCYAAHEQYPLILLANRDEFYERPTRSADFWPDCPQVLAGRDLKRNGTWLGITRSGRWAALTNYREPSEEVFERSRGDLVSDYLTDAWSAREFADYVGRIKNEFDGFNLLLGDLNESIWLSNRSPEVRILQKGVYGLSNHLLETPWPKVSNGKLNLVKQLQRDPVVDRLFEPLTDRSVHEKDLPQTGIDPAIERMLSSAYITSPYYGTRSSTLIMMNRDRWVYFEERSYDNRTSGLNRPDEYYAKIFQFPLDCTTL